jgi:hypothetical protein
MTNDKDIKKDEGHTEDPRAPYEPPTLEFDELFETLALACGKVQPFTFQCQKNNRLS